MSTILEEHTELGVYRRTQLGVYRRIKSCVFIEEHTELSVYRRTVRCLQKNRVTCLQKNTRVRCLQKNTQVFIEEHKSQVFIEHTVRCLQKNTQLGVYRRTHRVRCLQKNTQLGVILEEHTRVGCLQKNTQLGVILEEHTELGVYNVGSLKQQSQTCCSTLYTRRTHTVRCLQCWLTETTVLDVLLHTLYQKNTELGVYSVGSLKQQSQTCCSTRTHYPDFRTLCSLSLMLHALQRSS